MDRVSHRSRSVLALVAVVVLIGAACSPGASSSPSEEPSASSGGPSSEPSQGTAGGGELSIAVEGDVQSFDPAICYDTNCAPTIRMLYDQLVEYAPNSTELIPGLAEEMPTVSDDGLTYTFKLREGVMFIKGDGTPLREMVADDVVHSLIRVLDPSLTPTPSPVGAAFFSQIEGSGPVLDGTSKEASGLKAVDAHTVEIKITAANRAFLNVLAMGFGSIVPAELAGADTTAFSEDPVGTGAFFRSEYTKGEKAVFSRNESYWREGYPKLDKVEYRLVVDANTQLQQVQADQLDVMGNDIPVGEFTAVTTDPAYADQIIRVPLVATQFLIMDTSGPTVPLTNLKVRQAIAHAIDKDNILVVNNNRGVKAGCVFPPQFPTYRNSCDPYPYDVEAAKALMQESGFGSGFSTKLYTDTQDLSKAISESMIADLAEIGITAELVQQDFDVLIGTITTPHTAPLVFIGWFQDFPDSSDFYDPMFSCSANVPGGASFGWYCNEENDALAAKARSEPNEATRNQLYQQVEDALMADIPSVPLYNPDVVVLVTKRTIGNPFHPGYYIDLNEMDVTE
ncbi:MAG TPA: ABC transporter substrate-binding protein [Candidatus Polarisedimenticolia bacterium]|nr:ABC transporter substrate-binding protein [Candidatus Polarisedimenticolia bacterium]